MARTDALQAEGLQAAIDRAGACVEAGADMIFPEAMTELAQYAAFSQAVKVPILANITEFGATPLFSVEELRGVGVGLVLYPLSAFRAMSRRRWGIRRDPPGRHQKNVVDAMQPRMELYDHLGYHASSRSWMRCLPVARTDFLPPPQQAQRAGERGVF
jgi:methylisocitrate lyase